MPKEKHMASKLGSLTLDLIARIGNFVGPIQQAENQSNTSFGNMRNHINNYGTAVVAAAGAAALGLAALTSEYIDQATELERMAFRSNATTQEFQKLAAGAAAYGVEQEQLADQLKDFNEKLGELTTLGSGAGIDFFEQIAMKTEGGAQGAKKLILQMQKLSGPQALQLYIDKLEEAGVSHQQMSFYLESMGSDLTNLIPLFANGGEAAKIYGDAAERAGIIMSDNTIQQTKILKEQVYLLDLQMQGAKNQLMQAVIPAFVDISEAFFGGSEQGQQFTNVAEGVAKTLKGLAAIAIGAVTAFKLVGKTLGGLAAIGGAVYDKMDWYEMNPLGIVKAAYEARVEIGNLTQDIKADLHSTAMDLADRLNNLWDSSASNAAKKLVEIRSATSGVVSGLDDLVKKKEDEAEAEKKVASAAKATAEAKYKYTQKELEMLQRVSDLAAKNDLNGIGAKYGLPKNMLAALMAQESKGYKDALSPTGAIGYFQTTEDYRKDNKISIADSKNLPVIADVVAKNLAIAYEKLGSWEAAIRSHNAGVTGSELFGRVGRVNGSDLRNKEVREFAPRVDKWFVGLNGSDDANSGFISGGAVDGLKARQEYNDAILALDEKLKELQKQVSVKYQTELEAIEAENSASLKEIQSAFISDETNRNKYIELQRIVYEKDVAEFKKVEKQKQFEQINSLKSMQDQIKALGINSNDIFAKATMSPSDYSNWSLKNDRDNSQLALRDQLISTEQDIKTSDVYTNDDDRYQALLDAHQEYLYAKNALDIQYNEQVNDLAKSQQQEQLSLLSGILSNAQTTFSQLTQSAKDGAGEQSAMYRTMFALQQGFSIASSILAAHTAYTQAFADPSAMTLPQKIAGGMTVMAALMPALATISSVSLQGMAHDGIDNVPKEGTWLLDKGERVVDSRTNADLKNYLSNSKQQGAQIVINNNASTKVSATQGADGKTYITIDEVEEFINNSLQNPNSSMSKGISRGFNTQRRR